MEKRWKKGRISRAMTRALLLALALLTAYALVGCGEKDGAASEGGCGEAGSSSLSSSWESGASPSEGDAPSGTRDRMTFRQTGDGGSIGVWWWNNRYAKQESERTKYLDFLAENSVSEIYLWVGNMTDRQIEEFLLAAGARGMRVAWLSGDASWILPGVTGGEKFLREEFFAYQQRAKEGLRFYGLHMDVEPHQLQAFQSEREEILRTYAAYVNKVSGQVKAAGYEIEWDIPFWFDRDEVTLDEAGEAGKKESLLSYLAQRVDTLCIMSYRDRAEAILALSEEEIEAGRAAGCRILCGVDCYSEEGTDVSFAEDGRAALVRETGKVYAMLSKKGLAGGYGVAVHYLNSWFDLPD